MKPGAAAGTLLPAALFVFSIGLYANSVGNGFALDDTVMIEDNPLIAELGGIPALFTSGYWAHYTDAGLYRPLVTTSFALDHARVGLDPHGYHAVNVLLHALVVLLAWRLYRAVCDDPVAVTLASFFFAAHAIHTEAVANVVGRAELLAAAFVLGALLAHARAQAGGPHAARFVAGAAALYALALLSKESAITALAAFVLWDVSFPEHGVRTRRLRERLRSPYGAYLAVTAAWLALRWVALRGTHPFRPSPLDNPLLTLDEPMASLTALWVALRYVGLLVAPVHLSHDYSLGALDLIESWGDPRGLAAVLGGLAALAALPLAYRASRPLFFAWGFALLTFSVASNLPMRIGTILGERLVYLPSVGFCLAAVLAGRGLLARLPLPPRSARAVLCVVFGVVIAANGWRTVARNPDWRSDLTLEEAALAIGTGSAKVHYNVAHSRFEAMRFDEAIDHARIAVETWPRYGKAWMVLGHALVRTGRAEEALAAYEQAVRWGIDEASVHNNLGYMLLERGGDDERAVALIERAVELEPDNPSYLDSLGWAYFRTGRGTLEQARDLIARALALDDSGPYDETRRDHLAEVEAALERRGP